MTDFSNWICANQILPDDKIHIDNIAAYFNISKITAMLLYCRGYKDTRQIQNFINKTDKAFHNPFLLPDMDVACERINRAIEKGEKTVIYGDYDVDGITSVSVLYRYLLSRGLPVDYHIPDRLSEGYGINKSVLKKLKDENTSLIITVDNGSTSIDEANYAADLGIDLIITDHHECRDILPRALAIVNPRRVDSKYPFPELAGVGVAFKLISALESIYHNSSTGYIKDLCIKYIDIVSLGTIADVMPLTDENRLIVSLGLAKMNNSPDIWTKILSDEINVKSKYKKEITTTTIGYNIAPRINAAGRVEKAETALELFISDDTNKIKSTAQLLSDINRHRQEIENKIMTEAVEMIKDKITLSDSGVIVLYKEWWHQGVIGIVASRITDRYNLPCILISFDGDIGKASGRSIPGFNLVKALEHCKEYLEKYGGHELAAGLSLKKENVEKFTIKINDYAKKIFSASDTISAVYYDAELTSHNLSLTQAKELQLLQPYGNGNPEPMFCIRDCKIQDIIPLSGDKHLKYKLVKEDIVLDGMLFGHSLNDNDFAMGEKVDVLGNLSVNEFNGMQNIQFIISHIKPNELSENEIKKGEKLFRDISNGQHFTLLDNILPSYEDFAIVYKAIKKNILSGKGKQSIHYIKNSMPVSMNYTKIKFIVDIFFEKNLFLHNDYSHDNNFVSFCEMRDFAINYQVKKENLEKSFVYKKLKSQLSTD